MPITRNSGRNLFIDFRSYLGKCYLSFLMICEKMCSFNVMSSSMIDFFCDNTIWNSEEVKKILTSLLNFYK